MNRSNQWFGTPRDSINPGVAIHAPALLNRSADRAALLDIRTNTKSALPCPGDHNRGIGVIAIKGLYQTGQFGPDGIIERIADLRTVQGHQRDLGVGCEQDAFAVARKGV
jgi:hypothetical protein